MQRRWWFVVSLVFVAIAIAGRVAEAQSLSSGVEAPQAICTWNSGAVGNWNDPTKWSGCAGGVPGAADTAVVSSGTITLTSNVTLGTLTFSGGTIQGNSNLVVTNMTWTGGTFKDAGTTTVNGTLDMSNGSCTLDGRTLINAGAATLGGSSVYLVLLNNAVFTNQTGASMQFSHTSSGQITYSTGSGTFNNSGYITKTFASSGFTYIYAPFNNSGSVAVANGTFQMSPASSTINTNTGTWRTTSAGAAIQHSSGTLNVDGVITGTGTVYFAGGTVNFNTGTYSSTNTTVNGATVLFAPGTSFTTSNNLTLSSGTLNLSTGAPITLKTVTQSGGTLTGFDDLIIATYNWSGGTLSGAATTATVSGALNMTNSSVTLDGRTLSNAGTGAIDGSSAYLIMYNGAVFNNQAGASLQFSHTGSGQFTYSTGSGTFNNAGAITKTAASSGFTYIYVPFNNSGSVAVNGGTLYFGPTTATTSNHSGPFSVANGATLQVAGSGTLNFTGGVTGAGSGVFSGGTVNFNGGTYSLPNFTVTAATVTFAAGSSFNASTVTIGSGTLALNTGAPLTLNALTQSGGTLTGSDNLSITSMTWSGGTLSGAGATTTVTGTLDMSSSSTILDGRTFNNAGTATMGGTSFYMILYNGAVFNNLAGASLQFSHTGTGQLTYSTGGGAFNNSGVITKPLVSNGYTYIYPTFSQSGSFDVQGGIVYFSPNTATTWHITGSLALAAGATAQFGGSGTVNFAAGSSLTGAGAVTFLGSTVNFAAGSTYAISTTQINGGTADFSATSAVTFDDVTASSGTFRIGDITVTGDFTRTFSAFTALSGTVTFAGGPVQNLKLDQLTTFNNLTVSPGTTVVETVDANNGAVSGVLINQGTLRKTKSIPGSSVYTLGLTGATISVTVQGTLSSVSVDQVGANHPAATAQTSTGRYWTLTPTGSGYTVGLTLLNTVTPANQANVCYYDTGVLTWTCDKTSTTASTVTLNNITELAYDWAVGKPGGRLYLPMVRR